MVISVDWTSIDATDSDEGELVNYPNPRLAQVDTKRARRSKGARRWRMTLIETLPAGVARQFTGPLLSFFCWALSSSQMFQSRIGLLLKSGRSP